MKIRNADTQSTDQLYSNKTILLIFSIVGMVKETSKIQCLDYPKYLIENNQLVLIIYMHDADYLRINNLTIGYTGDLFSQFKFISNLNCMQPQITCILLLKL